MISQKPVVILGVFVADTAYRATRAPRMGETILGSDFKLGPGGKGSNQAVAAGRLGADVTFITRLGRDPFADMARATWKEAGVKPAVIETAESYTGAAYIFVEETTGDNAIIVCPGAALLLSAADVEANAALIGAAGVFVTQLEQPIEAALRGLRDRPRGRRDHDPQPRSRGEAAGSGLSTHRPAHPKRNRDRGTDRNKSRDARGRAPRGRQAARDGRWYSGCDAGREGRAAPLFREFRTCARVPGRSGCRDDGGRRRIQWGTGSRLGARAAEVGSRALRIRCCRHICDEAGYGPLNAHAGRSRVAV